MSGGSILILFTAGILSQKGKLTKPDNYPGIRFIGKCLYAFAILLSLYQSFLNSKDPGIIYLLCNNLLASYRAVTKFYFKREI